MHNKISKLWFARVYNEKFEIYTNFSLIIQKAKNSYFLVETVFLQYLMGIFIFNVHL